MKKAAWLHGFREGAVLSLYLGKREAKSYCFDNYLLIHGFMVQYRYLLSNSEHEGAINEVMKAYICNEKDWKLFREKVPGWQENYMEQLNREYTELLSGGGTPSEKFWALEKRIYQDKKKKGVMLEMRRSEMELNLLTLLAEGVIGLDDLTDFSEELQERIAFMARNMN